MIIGSRAKYVSESDAMDYVAGFAVMNDVSERTFQTKRQGQWTKGKSHDTFGPLGPWLVTRDEVSDPHELDMWLDVNGERRQTGNTNTLIFNVPHVVSYLLAVHDADARRRHHHRHPSGRRHGHEAAAISQARRRHDPRHRRARRAEADGHRGTRLIGASRRAALSAFGAGEPAHNAAMLFARL